MPNVRSRLPVVGSRCTSVFYSDSGSVTCRSRAVGCVAVAHLPSKRPRHERLFAVRGFALPAEAPCATAVSTGAAFLRRLDDRPERVLPVGPEPQVFEQQLDVGRDPARVGRCSRLRPASPTRNRGETFRHTHRRRRCFTIIPTAPMASRPNVVGSETTTFRSPEFHSAECGGGPSGGEIEVDRVFAAGDHVGRER